MAKFANWLRILATVDVEYVRSLLVARTESRTTSVRITLTSLRGY